MDAKGAKENLHKYHTQVSSLETTWDAPSYELIIDWLKMSEDKSIAFDVWARGNYVRHISHVRGQEIPPVVVPFRYLDELRCYYRRLAIMGLPVHFIYNGDLPIPKRHFCLHPDGMIDAGAGWTSAMGSKIRRRGREWFFIMGCARPMPNIFFDWLLAEGERDFLAGNLFISAAELVGIPRNFQAEAIDMTAELTASSAVSPIMNAAELVANFDLPYIDDLPNEKFTKILEDNDYRLQRFRRAIRKLVLAQYDSPSDLIEEIRDEVAQIALSDSNLQFRQTVAKFGGVFTTFGAGLSALGASAGRGLSTMETIGPAVIGAAMAGGVAVLIDLWKQYAERNRKPRENRFSILWDLGIKKPSDLKFNKRLLNIKRIKPPEMILLNENFDCHWMSPPGQMWHLFVREIE